MSEDSPANLMDGDNDVSRDTEVQMKKYKYELRSVMACFSSYRFWEYAFMLFLSTPYSSFFNFQYKEIGNKNNLNFD